MVVHLASAMCVSNLVSNNSLENGNGNGKGKGNGNGKGKGNGNEYDVSFVSKEAAATVINIEKIEIENLTIVKGKSQSAEVGKRPQYVDFSVCLKVSEFPRQSI
jgi:hypothetical protein